MRKADTIFEAIFAFISLAVTIAAVIFVIAALVYGIISRHFGMFGPSLAICAFSLVFYFGYGGHSALMAIVEFWRQRRKRKSN